MRTLERSLARLSGAADRAQILPGHSLVVQRADGYGSVGVRESIINPLAKMNKHTNPP